MNESEIQENILLYTDPKYAIRSELLWKKCGKLRKNDFYNVLHDMQDNNWIKRTKDGILRIDFSKKGFLSFKKDWVHDWAKDTRKLITKRHKPLFKKTKNGVYYLTKSAQSDLYLYFHECDFHTLNIYNRNFLAYRLKLINPEEYKRNNKEITKLFDFMFYGLINDHKSFKKQIIQHYMIAIHKTKFLV